MGFWAVKFSVYNLFSAIQGEATWTGRAAFFLRFSGCPLSCSWCDEPLHRDPHRSRFITAEQIFQELQQIDSGLFSIILTGGEPLAVKDLGKLVEFLKQHGYWLALETSGVGGRIPCGLDWITLSPKTPLPDTTFAMADEIKYIVGPTLMEHQTAEIQRRAISHSNVWVQPLSDDKDRDRGALSCCLSLIKNSNGRIRLSLQTHKLVGLP